MTIVLYNTSRGTNPIMKTSQVPVVPVGQLATVAAPFAAFTATQNFKTFTASSP